MVNRPLFAIAFAMTALTGVAGPVWSQSATGKSVHATALDAGPSATPDPLAPAEVNGPAPAAPGAPTAPVEAKPADQADPIVKLVRQRLTAAPAGGSQADRDDHAGLVAFYAEGNGQPVWTGKDGFTARATRAVGEIAKAGDWGLKASAFDVPALPAGSATEALADAEIKLGLAVLK